MATKRITDKIDIFIYVGFRYFHAPVVHPVGTILSLFNISNIDHIQMVIVPLWVVFTSDFPLNVVQWFIGKSKNHFVIIRDQIKFLLESRMTGLS